MNLKKWKIISIFLIFGLSALFHFGYDLVPSFLTSLIFPVNESIWEHNKIIILSFFFIAIMEKIYYKNEKNVFFSEAISSILCTIINMIIFTPIYLYILKTKDNMIVTFIIYLFSISISSYFSYKLLNQEYNRKKEIIGIILFLLIFIINSLLTYYPFHNSLFYDYTNKTYSIK